MVFQVVNVVHLWGIYWTFFLGGVTREKPSFANVLFVVDRHQVAHFGETSVLMCFTR